MGIEDEDFDMLAGNEGEDEGSDGGRGADIDNTDTATTMEPEDATDSPGDPETEPDAGEGGTDKEHTEGEDKEHKEGQTVPLAVLLDERKGFQSRMDEMNQRLGKLDAFEERMREIQERKQAEADKKPEPEYLDDPKEYVDHKLAKAEEKAEAADNKVTEMRQMTDQQAQMQQINNRLNTYDAEFVKESPDYYDALDYVRTVNIANIKAMGADEQTALTQAAQAMFMAQAQAMHKGVDPAKMMYEMAKRFGYTGKAPDPDPGKAQDAADDAIIAGQDAASMGGGAAPASERDEELDDDEFSEAFNELFGQAPR